MSSAAWVEVRHAFAGTLRLARGDRGGLACFDRTLDGFWRSFRAAVICYPLYLVLLALRVSGAELEAAGPFRIVLIETIAYVIAWAAFPLVMLPVSAWLEREDHFFDFMVAYNWCQLPQSALFVAIGLFAETRVAPGYVADAVTLLATVAVLVYEWYIARVALQTTVAAAIVVVLLDLVLGVLVSRAAVGIY